MTREARWIFVSAVALAALLVVPALQADHQWGNYHWARDANPFTVNMGDNVHAVWDAALALSEFDWSQSSVVDTPIVAGNTRPRQCRPTSGMVEVCADSYGNTGWLGIAQIWASGDHITQGIVKLNDTYYADPFYDNDRWRNLVMCQEIGHTLGLDHQDENFDNQPLGTCMDYSSNPGPADEHPNAHDYDMLEAMYAHLDGGSGGGGGGDCNPRSPKCNPMPPAASDIALTGPPQWGRMVFNNGRNAVFVLDFGNGNKVLTHVTWAVDHLDAHDH